MALTTHVAHTYGGMQPQPVSTVGRLAPWQEHHAKELLAANLQGGVTLSELASACGLSIRHFTRAFRGSTGMSPHAWLLHHRVEKAKGLLTNSHRVLGDIALDCGFADQSHFTRAFQRTAGASPGAAPRAEPRPRKVFDALTGCVLLAPGNAVCAIAALADYTAATPE